MKTVFKLICLSLFLGIAGIFVVSFFATFAHAQVPISLTFPGQTAPSSPDQVPASFVASFYTWALSLSGILAFGIIIFGGVKYMVSAGNPSGQGDAKEWIKAAILGILLLAGAYLILNVINPNLVNLTLPGNLPPVNIQSMQAGATGVQTAACSPPPNGPCSTASLSKYSCLGSNPALAAGICNVESYGGNPVAGGDFTTNPGPNGRNLPASVGLFQINLSAHRIPDGCTPGSAGCLDCPSAFSNQYTGSNPHTTITNMNLYNECVAAAETVSTNINEACQISQNGTNWTQWGPNTRQKCGV